MNERIVYFPFSQYKKITALQIIHNNRIKENGGYQKSLAYLSWKPEVSVDNMNVIFRLL